MNNLRRELELLLLLTENKDYSVQMLAERLDITRRQLYYDLENLRACGFKPTQNIDLTGIRPSLNDCTKTSLSPKKKP